MGGSGTDDYKDDDDCFVNDTHPGDRFCSRFRPSMLARLLYVLRIKKDLAIPDIRSGEIDKADRHS